MSRIFRHKASGFTVKEVRRGFEVTKATNPESDSHLKRLSVGDKAPVQLAFISTSQFWEEVAQHG